MKILLIDVVCKQGSTGKIVYDLYKEYIKEGHEAAICYGRGRKIDEPNVFKFSLDIETYFHALMTRLTGFTGCYSFFSTRRLLSFIQEYKPDVVHLHEMHAYFVNIETVIKYLKKNNIKTIWTFHCEFMYTGKCGYSYDCKKWKSQCDKCPHVKDYPASIVFDCTRKMFNDKKRLFRDFDNLIITTPSKWLADRVRQSFLNDKEIVVVYNGIDIENVFYPRNFDHLKKKHNLTDEKIVLAVAPDLMSNRKGGRYILELAKKMKNIKFILIGVTNLEEKFDDNVIVLGRTESQVELAEYYSMADITILPSKKETFSMVCAESLACGTPIVGFDAGAPKEVAPDGYGIFVPYGNVDRLEEAVQSVFNGSISVKSKRECVEFCKERYNKSLMFRSYLDIY